jgi:hypothetical protein
MIGISSMDRKLIEKGFLLLIRLFIAYMLIGGILVTFGIFNILVEAGLLSFLDTSEIDQYLIHLVLIALCPLVCFYFIFKKQKLLLFLSCLILVLHLVTLEYGLLFDYLIIDNDKFSYPIKLAVTPSTVILPSLLILNYLHFIYPNRFTEPYLVLLPVLLFICWYFQNIVTNLTVLIAAFIYEAPDISKEFALDINSYFFKSFLKLHFFYLIPLGLFILAKYWNRVEIFLITRCKKITSNCKSP